MRTLLGALCALTLVACGPQMMSSPTCQAPTGAGTKHAEDISASTTWKAADSPHIITSTPTVKAGATLTIEPCALVQIEAGQGLSVEGRLEALGNADAGIVITAADAAKPWSYLQVFGGYVDLAYVSLSNGGASGPNSNAMLDVWGTSTPQRTVNGRLKHVAITGSQQFGLTLERAGTLADDSSDVVISGAKLGPIMVRGAALAGGIPSGTYTGNTIDEIQVIARDPMTEDTTFHERGVPYRIGDANKNGVDFVVGVSSGAGLATLTLEPGVKFKFSATGLLELNHSGSSITGSLIARGTAEKPIVFTSGAATPAAGDWRGIFFDRTNVAASALDHVEIRYAGGPSMASSFHCKPLSAGAYSQNEDSAIAFFGEPTGAIMTNSLIADSAGDAVDLAYTGNSVDFTPTNTFMNNVGCRLTMPRTPPNGTCPNPVPACQ